MIAGSERGQANHVHQWLEVRHAPAWMHANGLCPADDYRLCWGCLATEALAEEH